MTSRRKDTAIASPSCLVLWNPGRLRGRVYLGGDASEQVLRGRISRGVTERINAVLWFSDLRGSTAISENIGPDEIIPFLNDYAQAAIDPIHEARRDVLNS